MQIKCEYRRKTPIKNGCVPAAHMFTSLHIDILKMQYFLSTTQKNAMKKKALAEKCGSEKSLESK